MNPVLKWMPLIIGATLVVSGCSRSGYYYDRNDEYINAEMVEPLTLPDSRNAAKYQNAMPVPDASSDFVAADGDFEAPRPRPLASSRDGETSFVESREAGQERWLVVNASPGGVWPLLQGFASAQGLQVESADVGRGRLETDQGTLSVRQGLRAGASEVRCEGSANEVQCLDALQRYLSANAGSQAGVSLAAQPLASDERVRLSNHDGEWQLDLSLNLERAWSELRYQLENDFETERGTLIDQNRSAGQFVVEYASRDDDGGWFDWFGGDDAAKRYRLDVSAAAENTTQVRVSGENGGDVPSSEARELLDAVAATLR
ncbi:outer membrane protein assembly factor BamC [Chromohalobacter israelensis]|uniref:outer membrane protein assembly factor BamC n=1 Tax=Chromohalobacter israelensis TaxID=141390 RepID=UPI000D713D94|nr:outer membrane protein assembly factor BamC [Chromohalobacter salexigens]MBZ5876879.1 outer membrane protein assembly factor BamC [Chromohalobacter salexigens]PWW42534.1 Beta-barrel assembly machine subunit BamC [Chromohalobacter salexigens]